MEKPGIWKPDRSLSKSAELSEEHSKDKGLQCGDREPAHTVLIHSLLPRQYVPEIPYHRVWDVLLAPFVVCRWKLVRAKMVENSRQMIGTVAVLDGQTSLWNDNPRNPVRPALGTELSMSPFTVPEAFVVLSKLSKNPSGLGQNAIPPRADANSTATERFLDTLALVPVPNLLEQPSSFPSEMSKFVAATKELFSASKLTFSKPTVPKSATMAS